MDRDLQEINSSGQLTEIKLGGTDAEKVVLTKEQVDALFGNFSFDGDSLENNGVFMFMQPGKDIGTISFFSANITEDSWSALQLSRLPAEVDITANGVSDSKTINLKEDSIILRNLEIADIDAGDVKSAVTKEWTEGKFGNYSFDGDNINHGSDRVFSVFGTTLRLGTDYDNLETNNSSKFTLYNVVFSPMSEPNQIQGSVYFDISNSKLMLYNFDWKELITDAPSDGKTYGRKDGEWVEIV